MTSHNYAERWLTVADHARIAVELISSGLFGQYALVEREGGFSLAGEVLAEIRMDSAGRITATVDGQAFEAASDEPTPLRGLARTLASVPVADWQAYGWAAFELSYAQAGLPAGNQPLAHLVIPRTEILVSEGKALVRSVEPEMLDAVEELLLGAPSVTPVRPARQVDVAEYGGEEYRQAVRAAVDDIDSGLLQKVILSRVVPVDFAVDLVATYERGLAGNTPVRSFLLKLGEVAAAGFSPEIVVEVDGDLVVTQPLAGTRALPPDRAEAERLRQDLLTDPKEIYEHAVSVQTSVEELSGVSVPGSVRVQNFMQVRERGSVQHLASSVLGDLAPDSDAWDALAAVFPAVTASGVPKMAAYDCIRKLEATERGLYGGVVLTVDSHGSMDATLVLRTVFQQDGRTWLRAGAGIVGQSRPEREYEETNEKLCSVSRFLVPAEDSAQHPAGKE